MKRVISPDRLHPTHVRDASHQRAFDFLTLLIGRDWVSLRDVAEHLGVTYRTAIRYAHAAERAGLVDWENGRALRVKRWYRGRSTSRLRLTNCRLRRP